ncbi:MAG: PHP domain-containing protein [Stygiobacter sp.]|nr:MAG: PHP domain-containing protein [Stygiobacter sp.]
MFEYIGVIHIHSVFSDGSGEVPEIAEFGKECGLDYLILTDHNTLRALQEGYERWYDNTLLLVGCEINDKMNQNHLLAMGISETVSTRIPAKEYTKKVKELGGISFIAHPHEKRSSMTQHPPYPWTEWECKDFDGIEIWNHMSEWMEGLTEQNKYNYIIHPLRSIVGPTEETLGVWDKLNLERKVVGIGGVDAHAHKLNLLGFFEMEVFPYKVLFKSVRTHVITEEKLNPSKDSRDIVHAKNLIYKALRNGSCFISNYYYGDAKGFRFFAEDGEHIHQMGESLPFIEKIKLRVILPNISATIKLVRNGELVDAIDGFDAEFKVKEPGVYRVEVFLNQNAWIFSNHIRIGL